MLDIVMILVGQQHTGLRANSSSIFFTPLIHPHNWAELPRQKPLLEEKALANWKVQKSVNRSFESFLQLWSDLMIGVFCAWEPNKLYSRLHTHKLCCVHHHFMVSEVSWSSLYLYAFTCTYRVFYDRGRYKMPLCHVMCMFVSWFTLHLQFFPKFAHAPNLLTASVATVELTVYLTVHTCLP